MVLPESFYKNRKLENLVENQTSYTLNNAALHIFETHQQAERVLLQFDQPVLASMLKGKRSCTFGSSSLLIFYPVNHLFYLQMN